MIDLYFDKLYRYDRIQEHCQVAIPVKKGELKSIGEVAVLQNNCPVPTQAKATAYYNDGSIKYLFLRFIADLPKNAKETLCCDLSCKAKREFDGITIKEEQGSISVNTKTLRFLLKNDSFHIFEELEYENQKYKKEQFSGPLLKDGNEKKHQLHIDEWSIIESGPLCAIFTARGKHLLKGKETENIKAETSSFELKLTAYAGKPWLEVSYRLINTTSDPLHAAALVFSITKEEKGSEQNAIEDILDTKLAQMNIYEESDSTGCGDKPTDNSHNAGPIYVTRGTGELDLLEKKAGVERIRTCVGSSNYKTEFYIGRDGEEVNRYIDEKYLLKEANEHFSEVFYGTFFADRTDEQGGVCATVFQAQQNYPKAVKADKNGIYIMLVPENIGHVVMQPGMSREQKFLLHFHNASETLKELDNRSLIYQMPDRPWISPKVFKESGVMPDIFPEKLNEDVEIALIQKGDVHARCFGMLNWGDAPDAGYTTQGRGNGEAVWSNNEYDYPHACALMYARTGIRRFLDYMLVSCSHWMDVDVCHYSDNPLRIGGQWEHTNGHVKNGVMVCSHEWVEGLLDYYHFTGDERGLKTALGIGENVIKLLDTPMFAHTGEANARETGWALRTLTALFVETNDKRWLEKSNWIIGNFEEWEEEYGNWLAPYTDNTTIRVGFMISVAIGSVMRFYRIFPNEDIKKMLIRAVDDLIENCLLDNGLFYYKELPSLNRLGNNTLLLEALSIAYELTGDVKYLLPGLKTFRKAIDESAGKTGGKKEVVQDAVIYAGPGTKGFAQSFLPLITFYNAISENDISF